MSILVQGGRKVKVWKPTPAFPYARANLLYDFSFEINGNMSTFLDADQNMISSFYRSSMFCQCSEKVGKLATKIQKHRWT